jgi:hypothetical protein
MGRRAKGLKHMISTDDSFLEKCRPVDASWDEFMLNCEEAINCADLHSDEVSSDDEACAKEERDSQKRPENIFNTSSVIKVYKKNWRSTRVSKVAMLFFSIYIIYSLLL